MASGGGRARLGRPPSRFVCARPGKRVDLVARLPGRICALCTRRQSAHFLRSARRRSVLARSSVANVLDGVFGATQLPSGGRARGYHQQADGAAVRRSLGADAGLPPGRRRADVADKLMMAAPILAASRPLKS